MKYFYINYILIFFLFLIIYNPLTAQDSTSIEFQLQQLKQKVDSLEIIIKNGIIDTTRTSTTNTPNNLSTADTSKPNDLLSEFTSFFSFNQQDQSSRRKRIDDLLNILRNQPGTITFKGDATSIVQWKNGYDHFFTGSGSFDLFAFVAFGDNTNLFIDLEAVGGNGPNEKINSFSSLNGDAGSLQTNDGKDILHVLEAWSEFKFFGNWLKITVGKIDLTNYFDLNDAANDETLQFISGPFINSSALPVPSNSPGLRTLVGIENLFTFQFGLVSSDNSGDELFSELFKIIGTEVNVDFGADFRGNVNLYFYNDGIIEDALGYGLSFSGSVANYFKLFGRWNENNSNYKKGFPIRDYWMIGTELNTTLFDQQIVLGSAFGVTHPYLKSLYDEYITESYFRIQLNKWVYLSPHIQYVQNANGSQNGYLITAFRTQINF